MNGSILNIIIVIIFVLEGFFVSPKDTVHLTVAFALDMTSFRVPLSTVVRRWTRNLAGRVRLLGHPTVNQVKVKDALSGSRNRLTAPGSGVSYGVTQFYLPPALTTGTRFAVPLKVKELLFNGASTANGHYLFFSAWIP